MILPAVRSAQAKSYLGRGYYLGSAIQALLRTSALAIAVTAALVLARPICLQAQVPNLTGTYSADDGGIYYLQQSGSQLWWAGMSLDSGMTADKIWHRGLEFTNVFRGAISGTSITGEWADVTRGSILSSGSMTLTIGSYNGVPQLTKSSATGGFGATTWNQIPPLDDTLFNGHSLNIIERMDLVRKNLATSQESLTDNLKTYRDQTVVYGRVVNEYVSNGSQQQSLPHIAFGPPPVSEPDPLAGTPFDTNGGLPIPLVPYYDFSQPSRDFPTFASWNEYGGNGDGDIDIGLSLDTNRLEDYFFTTGWGYRATGPTIFSLKFGYSGDQSLLNYAAFIHPEGLMYGKAGTCNSVTDCSYDTNYGDASLLPGWADLNGNSILINGSPINGVAAGNNCNVYIEPCPYLGGATAGNYLDTPTGIALRNLLLSQYGGGSVSNVDSNYNVSDSSGAYVRITGNLVVDCGHGSISHLDTHPCYDDLGSPDDVVNYQNQEIHPIYSIDVINKPYRPEDLALAGRSNLTGAWGGTDGSTYYVRQIGNTIWWLGLMRDRQPMQDGTGAAWSDCNLSGSGQPSGIIGTCGLAPAFNANNPACSTPGQCWAFANVFHGTITHSTDFDIIVGDWAGVPQSTSAGSTGGHMTFYVYSNKSISPATTGSIFPPSFDKMYESSDTTPPQSNLTIGTPQYPPGADQPFVNTVTSFRVTATDADSGVQNIWYRFFPQGSTAPSYTSAVGSSTAFNLTGADGSYEVDTYATDNAGNDESAHSKTVYLDNTPPVATISQPLAAQYGHSDPLPLNYTVSDGSGSGVSSFSALMDGLTAQQFGASLDSGQTLYLYSLQAGAHTFSVNSADNLNNIGTNSVTFTITVTFASLGRDVTNLQALGCIDNIGQSLTAKLNAAQSLYGKGQIQTAINILAATIAEVQAQAGKHISTSCHDPNGRLFNSLQLLLGDLQYLQTTLAGQLSPDPIMGTVANSSNLTLAGVTVNLLSSSKTVVATTTTDSAGFYYFADVSWLAPGASYAVTVPLPKGYKSATPASQTFTWKAASVSLNNFVLK